jgi:hypothetical protein
MQSKSLFLVLRSRLIPAHPFTLVIFVGQALNDPLLTFLIL